MSSLEERLEGQGARPWIPDPAKAAEYNGDSVQINPLIGVFVDHSTRANFKGDGVYDVVTLLVEGVGEVAVHCQATVLASQMHQARPVFGETVGVKWLGTVQRHGQADYTNYVVRVDRAQKGGAVQWADGGSVPAAPPAPPEQPIETFQQTQSPVGTTTSPPQPTDDDIPF